MPRTLWGLLIACIVAASLQAAPPASQPVRFAYGQLVRVRIAATLDKLQQTNDFAAAQQTLQGIFDQVIALAPARDIDLFVDAAGALRMVNQLEEFDPQRRIELLGFLRENPNLAATLAFLIQSDEKPAEVYAVLDRLRTERGKLLDRYATLAAAICVVHDRPLVPQAGEDPQKCPDALGTFDYFLVNERLMSFGLVNVPAELLIHVVNVTASVDELNWAAGKYAGSKVVGNLFFDIKYDTAHFRRGVPKKVLQAGYTLQNLLKHGGVCIDQAYFATTVGKAIGVPTAIVVGSGKDVSHAWVGFLRSEKNRGWWDFDIGRYEDYESVRGDILDPQTRRDIPDSYVGLSSELIGTRPQDRFAAAALTDAAMRIGILVDAQQTLKVPSLSDTVVGANTAKPREATLATELELLEMAVRQSPGSRDAWFTVRRLAADGKLTLDMKRKWAGALLRVCGERYPDFALAVLTPMIRTVDNVDEQNTLWNSLFSSFGKREDLAAAVRMNQATMWEAAGRTDLAGQCYMDVIERYANSGRFVLAALERAEDLLRKSQREENIPTLYQQTWKSLKRPKRMASPFMAESNYVRVGMRLAEVLDAAGRSNQAEGVRQQLQELLNAGQTEN